MLCMSFLGEAREAGSVVQDPQRQVCDELDRILGITRFEPDPVRAALDVFVHAHPDSRGEHINGSRRLSSDDRPVLRVCVTVHLPVKNSAEADSRAQYLDAARGFIALMEVIPTVDGVMILGYLVGRSPLQAYAAVLRELRTQLELRHLYDSTWTDHVLRQVMCSIPSVIMSSMREWEVYTREQRSRA